MYNQDTVGQPVFTHIDTVGLIMQLGQTQQRYLNFKNMHYAVPLT